MTCPVLIIDDDAELTDMLGEYLGAEGFAVSAVHDGLDALRIAGQGRHALAVLDIMLPGLGGLEVLRQLRQTSMMPVLMLTARGSDLDRIVGLELGADDYMPKPFNPRELVARMRAILRRFETHEPAGKAGFAALEVDSAKFEARLDGVPLGLTGTEFRILETLAGDAPQIHSREALTQAVLGRRLHNQDRSIDTHISNIRRKLALAVSGAGSGMVDIKSIRGRGYVLVVGGHRDAL